MQKPAGDWMYAFSDSAVGLNRCHCSEDKKFVIARCLTAMALLGQLREQALVMVLDFCIQQRKAEKHAPFSY